MKWSNRSLGSHFQHKIFHIIVRCRALPLARALLAFVALYYTLLPHVRRRCSYYLQRRFTKASKWTGFVHAYRLYFNFGQILLDRMVAGTTGYFSIRPPAPAMREVLWSATRRPHGCILLSAHIGAWQMALAGLEEFDRPVYVVQPYAQNNPDKHYFELGNGRAFQVINALEPIGALIEANTALRSGGIVCLMGDRLMGNQSPENSVTVPFLGGKIALPVNAYVLASMTGAELVMLFSVREKGCTQGVLAERLDVPPGLPRHDPTVFLPYATRFAKAMEELVRDHPYQFFNFYNMWLDDYDKN